MHSFFPEIAIEKKYLAKEKRRRKEIKTHTHTHTHTSSSDCKLGTYFK